MPCNYVRVYQQDTDPGTVGALRWWLDTSVTPNVLYVRNITNTGWITVGGSGGGGGTGASINDSFVTMQAEADLTNETLFSTLIGRGATGTRPAAGIAGRLFYDTTLSKLYRDNGAAWEDSEGVSGVAHNILSATHGDATADAAVRGDIIVAQGASPKWVRLPKGALGQHLVMGADEPAWADNIRTIGISIDGGGVAITTGIKGDISVKQAIEILEWEILADPAGAIVIDVWCDTYANYPPTDADALPGAGHEPTIAATNAKGQGTATGVWHTVTVAAGSTLRFNVDSCATITRATLVLKVKVV